MANEKKQAIQAARDILENKRIEINRQIRCNKAAHKAYIEKQTTLKRERAVIDSLIGILDNRKKKEEKK